MVESGLRPVVWDDVAQVQILLRQVQMGVRGRVWYHEYEYMPILFIRV